MADSRRQLALLTPAAGQLSVLRDRGDEGAEPAGGLQPLVAALEHIPSAAFVCDGAGRVAAANAPARRRLEEDEAFARRALDGGEAQVSPLPVSGAGRRFLVVTRRRDPAEVAVERAARAWELTAREVEVLAEIAAGRGNGQIAGRFGLARRTVELHVTSLLRKAGLQTRAQLIVALWRLSASL